MILIFGLLILLILLLGLKMEARTEYHENENENESTSHELHHGVRNRDMAISRNSKYIEPAIYVFDQTPYPYNRQTRAGLDNITAVSHYEAVNMG